jgi:hypothetical protein
LGRILILVAVVVGLFLLVRWFVRTPPQQVRFWLKKLALWGGIGTLVALAATGRLPWLFAVISAAIPALMRVVNLLRLVPMLRQLAASLGLRSAPAAGGAAGGGQSSSIRTRFVEMSLDHHSGAMDGLVLEGAYQGRHLGELGLEPLLELLARWRAEDAQSAAVLEAYLDRTQGDVWRAKVGAGQASVAEPSGPMSREEAAAVLGVAPAAGEEEIRAAHRRLMQKLHPDRGGSNYLAAKINQAKDLLLGH